MIYKQKDGTFVPSFCEFNNILFDYLLLSGGKFAKIFVTAALMVASGSLGA